jgi:hypothetical protein
VMFVQGGAGDINPLFLGRSEDEATDFGITQKMGETLAAEVLKANSKAAAHQQITSAIAHRMRHHRRSAHDHVHRQYQRAAISSFCELEHSSRKETARCHLRQG